MKNTKYKSIKVPLVSFFLSIFLLNFSPVLAQNDPLVGLDKSAGKVKAFTTQMSSYQSGTFLQTKVGQAIGIVLSFVGVLFLILMIYAGILWMTSQGNEQQVAKAKGMLVNGIIGLIIVFAAYTITSFIGSEVLK